MTESKTRMPTDPAMFKEEVEPLATIIFHMEEEKIKVKARKKKKYRQGERTRGIFIYILFVFDINIHVGSQRDSPRVRILLAVEVIRVLARFIDKR